MGQLYVILYLTAQFISCLSRHDNIAHHNIRCLLFHEHIGRIRIKAAYDPVIWRKQFIKPM